VAVGSTAALICDTGALLDYLVISAPDHREFRRVIDRARTRYVPGLVLAEVDYFLREEREAMRELMADLERGAFTYAPPELDQLMRAIRIDEQYEDLDLGLVDASIVALAEEIGVRRIATRDVKHFTSVRLQDGTAFELVVVPTTPET
jgi:predicted nucleic acid-binding protein